jgi:monoamine oxidase
MSLIEKNVKTIIIGSGMSGIGAAVNFLKQGYDDFVIIEAENRIGILNN